MRTRANDIGGRADAIARLQQLLQRERGIEKDLRYGPAVDMHYLAFVDQHVEHHRGKHAWQGRRRKDDLGHGARSQRG